MIFIPFSGWGLRGIYNSNTFEKLIFLISEPFEKYLLNYLHTHVTNVLLHICKLCRILHVLITMYTSSLDQKVIGKNSNRNFCYHNRCWNSCFNNDFWNICSDKCCWNSCFNKNCWNSRQRNTNLAAPGALANRLQRPQS